MRDGFRRSRTARIADSAPGLATLQQRLDEYVPPKSKSDMKYTQVECDLDNLLDEAASALARLYNHRSRPNVVQEELRVKRHVLGSVKLAEKLERFLKDYKDLRRLPRISDSRECLHIS